MAYAESTAEADAPEVRKNELDREEVLREFKVRMKESEKHGDKWRTEAKELYDLQAGKQWSEADKEALRERYGGAYPDTTFNLFNKYIDAVTGLQINNRQEIRYYPRKPGDSGVDEYSTGVAKWNRDQSEAEDEETDAFGDVFLTGMAWIEHELLDEQDPESPYIGQERRDPLKMRWDPRARRRNLVDRRYQIYLQDMSSEEYEEFFGEEAENLEGAASWMPEDSSPQRVTIPNDYGTGTLGVEQPPAIYVADYQFCRLRDSWNVVAQFPEGELSQTFTKAEWRVTKKDLQAAGISFKAERVQIRVHYRARICGDEIKKLHELPCGFTYEAITGKRDRNSNTWYGMGRVIRDPQMWVNKFFASILYTISVNAKGGLMAEEDAFEDQSKAESSWANPAAITWVAPGALANGKVQPKPPAQYPQGMDRLMEFTLSLLPLTSGMNPELMGLADREQPGVLEAQRKQSAMSIIAWVFDAMRRYYKRSGTLLLSMIREYLSEGQLVRITGKEGARYVPLIKNKLVAKYDVIVDEAPTSVNMRERVWVILNQIIPMALQAGIPVPPDVLDYAPLPQDLAQKWKKRLEPTPQQQQDQQQQQQTAQRAADAQIAKDESAAQLNIAKVQQIGVESNLKPQSTAISDALTQAQTMKTAAEAGKVQAGE